MGLFNNKQDENGATRKVATPDDGMIVRPEEHEQQIQKELERLKPAIKKAKKFTQDWGVKERLRNFANVTNTSGREVTLTVNLGGGSYTDGKNVTVGLAEDYLEEDEETWMAYMQFVTAHELGHVNFSDFKVFKGFIEKTEKYFEDKYQIKGAGGFGGHMLNCTEDGRIEAAQAFDQPGLLRLIRFVNGRMYLNANIDNMGYVPLHDFVNCVLTLSKMGLVPEGFNDRFKGTDVYEAVKRAKPYIMKAVTAETAEECAQETWNVIKVNEDFLSKWMKEHEIQQPPSGNGEGEDSDDQNEQSQNSQGQENGSGQDSQSGQNSQSQSASGKTQQAPSGKVHPLDGMNGKSDYTNSPAKRQAKQAKNADGSPAQSEAHFGKNDSQNGDELQEGDEAVKEEEKQLPEQNSPQTMEQAVKEMKQSNSKDAKRLLSEAQKLANKKKQKEAYEKREKEKYQTNNQEVYEVMQKEGVAKLLYRDEEMTNSKRIPRILEREGKSLNVEFTKLLNNQQPHTLYNQKSGRLDVRRLHRIPVGVPKVFKKKNIPDNSTYAVSVLIDNSGSMSGERADTAQRMGTILELGLKGIVPLKVQRFHYDWGQQAVHSQMKGWEQKTTDKEVFSWKACPGGRGGNYDAFSVAVAAKELEKRPETDKILFVISDGLPSAGDESDVKSVVKEMKDRGMKIIGIGVGSEDFQSQNKDNYQYMYGDEVILTDEQGLRKEVVNRVRRIVNKQ